MSDKNRAKVLIGGSIYELYGFESEEYLQKVAGFINTKIEEIEGSQTSSNLSLERKSVLIELNLADEYFKAKKQAENMEMELKDKEKELYDLRHSLVEAQMKGETQNEHLQAIEEENKKLAIENAALKERLLSMNERHKEEESLAEKSAKDDGTQNYNVNQGVNNNGNPGVNNNQNNNKKNKHKHK